MPTPEYLTATWSTKDPAYADKVIESHVNQLLDGDPENTLISFGEGNPSDCLARIRVILSNRDLNDAEARELALKELA